LPIYAHF